MQFTDKLEALPSSSAASEPQHSGGILALILNQLNQQVQFLIIPAVVSMDVSCLRTGFMTARF